MEEACSVPEGWWASSLFEDGLCSLEGGEFCFFFLSFFFLGAGNGSKEGNCVSDSWPGAAEDWSLCHPFEDLPDDFLGDFPVAFLGGFCGEPSDGCPGDLPWIFLGDTSGDLSGDPTEDLTGEFSDDDAGGDMRTIVRARINLMAFERAFFCCPSEWFSSRWGSVS